MKNWFDHDYGARNDEKILELRAKYNAEGYGLYWMLIESMAENNGRLSKKRMGGLSVGLGVAYTTLEAFINDCLELELFSVDTDGFIYSERLLRHVNKIEALSEAGRRGAEIRTKNREIKKLEGELKPPLSHPSTEEKRIEENRIDNNRKENTHTPNGEGERETNQQRFEAIYQTFPKHRAKINALKSIAKAYETLKKQPSLVDSFIVDVMTNASEADKELYRNPLTLLERQTKRYAIFMANYAERFIPFPATWFNSGDYLSPPSAWKAQAEQFNKETK